MKLKDLRAFHPHRVLLVRLGALGDVVRTMPAVAALRRLRPEAHLTWLVEEAAAPILEGFPALDGVRVLPRKSFAAGLGSVTRFLPTLARIDRERRALAAERYDLALDFQGTLKSGLCLRATRAPVRVGFARGFGREGNHHFLTHPVAPDSPRLPRPQKFLSLVRVLGDVEAVPRVRFPERPAEAAAVARFLEAAGPGEGPRILLWPGTSRRQAYKRWPARQFAELADALAAAGAGPVLIGWGPGEEALRDEVLAAATSAPRATPLFSLWELVELIRACHLVVAGDTGPMHIAGLLDVPLVVLYPRTDPVVNAPLGARHRLLAPANGTRTIPTPQALAAARELLA